MTVLRVAANDSSLAHGIARAGIDGLAAKSAALYDRLQRKTPAEISKILRRHFGDLLLLEEIEQRTRQQVKGESLWLVLDADAAGEELQPVRVVLRRSGFCYSLHVAEYRLRFTRHALARLLQRTVNVGNIRATGRLLLDHVAQAGSLVDAGQVRGGDNVQTSTLEGVVLWTAKRNVAGKLLLIGKTWISSAMATETQAAACSRYTPVVTRRRRRATQ
jgi:hypothetical protein